MKKLGGIKSISIAGKEIDISGNNENDSHVINFTIWKGHNWNEKSFLDSMRSSHAFGDMKGTGKSYCYTCKCDIEKCGHFIKK